MTNTREYSEFTGFTENEVKKLCDEYDIPYSEMKRWYDGYGLKGVSVYNPRSVVMSLTGRDFDNYWTATETFEALKVYIELNIEGLRDDIVKLLSGEEIRVDTTTFTNDMVSFHSKDDVLTLLVHLGYLTYNFYEKTVRIPNYEISQQFAGTVKIMDWGEVAKSLKTSDELLKATLACKSDKVAALIQQSHMEDTSILKYKTRIRSRVIFLWLITPLGRNMRCGANCRQGRALRTWFSCQGKISICLLLWSS